MIANACPLLLVRNSFITAAGNGRTVLVVFFFHTALVFFLACLRNPASEFNVPILLDQYW